LCDAEARFLIVGAPLHDLNVEDLAAAGIVYQMGVPPRRIDVMTSITGVAFTEGWSGRVAARYGEVPFFVLGREALIKNKQALARPKDLLDVDLLQRSR
jgi:hypothetical protein